MRAAPFLFALLLAACGPSDAPADTHEARTAAEHQHDEPAPSGAVAGVDTTRTRVETVTYARLDGRDVRGFLARPASAPADSALPGLVVIHEWWGLNDNVRQMARRLAEEGYAVLAVDLYGGRVATTPDSATALMEASLAQAEGLGQSVGQALAYLRDEEGAPRVGVLGWCFGGGWSLQTALQHADAVDAAVMYYGRLVPERERLAALRAPLLGHFGATDDSIPVADVRAMEATLRDLGKDATIFVYDGAGHAFANPSGERYDARAADLAWMRTTAFLTEHLQ